MNRQTIPVVDFSKFRSGTGGERTRFVEEVGHALQDLGFFALENHGVEAELIARAYAQAQAFFDLPPEVKLQYELSGALGQRGYTRFGREHAKDSASPDLKEFWQVGRTFDDPRLYSQAMPANVWPSELPLFEATFRGLYAQLEACALGLLEACALSCGLPASRLRDAASGGDSILRVIHYPAVPPERDPASVRAAAHEDINFITLLCESTADGLELLTREGKWLPIRSLPGQIIVDSGDMLQNLTNGLLRSTTHRVSNPGNDRERRFSLPFFTHPRPEVDLSPLPECVAQTGGAALYPRLTARELLTERLRAIGLG
jgi:isopenicillin N synthase-like dioxygenase